MELRQLITFCKVAELQSFTKAAEALFITQAAVSQQIKMLEQELGGRLFEREPRQVTLTEAGRELYPHAKEIIRRCEAMKQAVGQAARTVAGEVRVAASTIPGEHILPERLARFRGAYPQVRVTVLISDSERTLEEISAARVDVAVVGLRPRSERLHWEVFDSDRLVVVVAPSHPWARRRKPVPLAEFLEAPFVLRSTGSGTRQCLATALEAVGHSLADLKVAVEVGSSEAAKSTVLQGASVSALSVRAVERDLTFRSLRAIEVEGLRLEREFYLVTNPRRLLSPAASVLVNFLRQCAQVAQEAR